MLSHLLLKEAHEAEHYWLFAVIGGRHWSLTNALTHVSMMQKRAWSCRASATARECLKTLGILCSEQWADWGSNFPLDKSPLCGVGRFQEMVLVFASRRILALAFGTRM